MEKERIPRKIVFWKSKLPLKIFFLWYLKRGVVLTKDNLKKEDGREKLSVVYVG